MAFERYDCNECGEAFKAYPDAVAAREGYCSPACRSAGADGG